MLPIPQAQDDKRPGKKRRAIARAELPRAVADVIANSARAPPSNIELWTAETTCAFFGGNKSINMATLYRGIASGRFPKPINISANIVRWVADECREALAQIIARRDAGERTTPRPGAGRRAA